MSNQRGFFRKALVDATALDALLGNRIYPRGSLGIGGTPAEPDLPYLMFAVGDALSAREVRDTAQTTSQSLRIYVYDAKGSYVRIDEIHRIVRETLEVLSGYDDGVNWRCTDIVFSSLGEETTDGPNNLRIAVYRITGPQ